MKAWFTKRRESQYHAIEERLAPITIALCGAWLDQQSRLEFRLEMPHVCAVCATRYRRLENAA